MREMRTMTLIEMTVSVAIIAIIAVTAIISFSSLTERKLEADARKVLSEMSFARELAVSTHNDSCVLFNASDYEIFAGSCGTGFLIQRTTLETVITSPAVPFRLTFCAFNSAYCKSVLSPNYILGGMAYSPQSINNELNITLNKAGSTENVRIFEWTGYGKIE